eukprot:3883772-Amphidinium_carterae.1
MPHHLLCEWLMGKPFRRLALKALRCAEYGKKKEELDRAEERKKEAVARDDFEGCAHKQRACTNQKWCNQT